MRKPIVSQATSPNTELQSTVATSFDLAQFMSSPEIKIFCIFLLIIAAAAIIVGSLGAGGFVLGFTGMAATATVLGGGVLPGCIGGVLFASSLNTPKQSVIPENNQPQP